MFYNYIKELGNRISLLIITWVSVTITSYYYKEVLIFILVTPSLVVFEKNTLYFIFTNLSDIFSTYIKLACFMGNQFLCVFLFYHFVIFLSPGLRFSEFSNTLKIFFLSLFLWLCAILTLNTYVLPFSWQFFLSFQNSTSDAVLNFHLEAKINEYLDFYINLYYLCCLNFQFLIILSVFLESIKNNLGKLKTFRKFFYFGFFFIATIVTPPDILSQICLGIGFILVHEIMIIIIILKTNLLKSVLRTNLVAN